MAFYNKIIDLCRTQVGYHEGRSNGTWNNDQKYSKEVPGFGWSNYQAWCATFNTWIDWKLGLTTGAGDDSKSPCTASVRTAYDWGVSRGRFTEYPVIGAWMIFGKNKDEHTERCIGYDGTFVYSIGGNTNNNFSASGDGVYLHKRRRDQESLIGYVVPVLPDDTYLSPDPKWHHEGTPKVIDDTHINATIVKPATATAKTPPPISFSVTKRGADSGKPNGNVKIYQHLLNVTGLAKSFVGHNIKEDGIFGSETRAANAGYQKMYSDRHHLNWTAADCDGLLGETSFAGLTGWNHSYTPVK